MKNHQRDEYAVCLSPLDEFTQVSMSMVFTQKGGKHVDYVMNQIVKKLLSYIEKEKDKGKTNYN